MSDSGLKITAYVYIVECMDGTYYTGWTTDINKRIRMHNIGKGAKYTRYRVPVVLRYVQEFATKQEAMRQEYRIKQLGRAQKSILITSWKNEYHDR